MQKIMKMKQKLLLMLAKNSVIITTSISGRGVDIQLGGKKGSDPIEIINKNKKKK